MRPLAFSNPRSSEAPPAQVSFEVESQLLIARFQVSAKSIFGKKDLGPKEYPYDFDVVEVFVTNSSDAKPKYFEFEVTPYNQGLQVNVIDPRQEFYFGVKDGFEHRAAINVEGWEAELRIPLQTIGCDARQPLRLRGGAFAALGEGASRVYWSLFELPAGKPDFHVPAAFQPLLT